VSEAKGKRKTTSQERQAAKAAAKLSAHVEPVWHLWLLGCKLECIFAADVIEFAFTFLTIEPGPLVFSCLLFWRLHLAFA